MKYAHEVIDLLGCYPGREFRMAEILRHVSRGMAQSETAQTAMRRGVLRVLDQLMDSGQVVRSGGSTKSALYSWHLPASQMSQSRSELRRDMRHYARPLAS